MREAGLLFLLICGLAGHSGAAPAAPRAFSFSGVSNRIITPNGDGRNDNAAFRFSNPRDSGGTLKIYDVRGHELTSLPVEVGQSAVVWDARAGGTIVRTGVYIYVLTIEKTSVSGSVVVVR